MSLASSGHLTHERHVDRSVTGSNIKGKEGIVMWTPLGIHMDAYLDKAFQPHLTMYGVDFSDPGKRSDKIPRKQRHGRKALGPEQQLGSQVSDLVFGTGPVQRDGQRLEHNVRPPWTPASIPGFMGINSAFTPEVAAGMAMPPDEKADFLMDSSGGARCYVHRSTSAPPRSSAWGRSHGFRDGVIVISPSEDRARAERRALVPDGHRRSDHNFSGGSMITSAEAHVVGHVEGAHRTLPRDNLQVGSCAVDPASASRSPVGAQDRGVRMRRPTQRHVSEAHVLGSALDERALSSPRARMRASAEAERAAAPKPHATHTRELASHFTSAPSVYAPRLNFEIDDGAVLGANHGRVDVMRRLGRIHGDRVDGDRGHARDGARDGGSGGARDGAPPRGSEPPEPPSPDARRGVVPGAPPMHRGAHNGASATGLIRRAGQASPLLARRSALEGHPLHYFSERTHIPDGHAHDGAAGEGTGAVVGAKHVGALRPSVWGVGSHDVSTHGMLHYDDEPNAHNGANRGETRGPTRAPRSLSPRPEASPNLDRPEASPNLDRQEASPNLDRPKARPQPWHGDRSPRGGGGGSSRDGGGALSQSRSQSHPWGRGSGDGGGALGSPRGRIGTSGSGGSVGSSPRSRSSSSSRLTYALVSPRPSRRGTSAAALEARAGHFFGAGLTPVDVSARYSAQRWEGLESPRSFPPTPREGLVHSHTPREGLESPRSTPRADLYD